MPFPPGILNLGFREVASLPLQDHPARGVHTSGINGQRPRLSTIGSRNLRLQRTLQGIDRSCLYNELQPCNNASEELVLLRQDPVEARFHESDSTLHARHVKPVAALMLKEFVGDVESGHDRQFLTR